MFIYPGKLVITYTVLHTFLLTLLTLILSLISVSFTVYEALLFIYYVV